MAKNQVEIRELLLKVLPDHPHDIATVLSNELGVSRQRAHFYLTREIKRGTVIRVGNTRASRYFLVGSKRIQFSLKLKPNLDEDKVWSSYIKPMLVAYSDNLQRIANYSFKEILNNAIDHSEGSEVYIQMTMEDAELCITLMDNGVGIFRKIQKALNLESDRESILHLSKGKFTTDPKNHSGQGIFFTSRMVGKFSILSGDLYYLFHESEWMVSNEKPEPFGKGTYIYMEIPLDVKHSPKDIFDLFSDVELGFHKTSVAVALSSNPNDPHNSRSQAKRLVAGLEKFKTVVLDFRAVSEVGQAFVDEVFRVFKNENPGIRIEYINANPGVDATIKAGLAENR